MSPQLEISSLQIKAFLLDSNEAKKLRYDMKVLVGRILIQKIQKLTFLKQVIPKDIVHQYQNEMSEKSVIVPLPRMLKDEKYEDVVDILDGYEQHLEDIFVKAKVIEKPDDDTADETPPIISGQSL